jgi:hypothetical protein
MCKALSKCVHGVRRQHHPELDVAIDLPPSSPISLPSRASSPPTLISTLAGRPHPKSVVSYTPCLRPTHGHGRAKHRQHPAQPPARAFQHALLHLPDRAPDRRSHRSHSVHCFTREKVRHGGFNEARAHAVVVLPMYIFSGQ